MTLRTRIVLVILWIASLILVAAWGQTPDNRARPPRLITGSDLGFRVEGRTGDTLTGTLMVRINGEWVIVDRAERFHRLKD